MDAGIQQGEEWAGLRSQIATLSKYARGETIFLTKPQKFEKFLFLDGLDVLWMEILRVYGNMTSFAERDFVEGD